MDRNARAQPRGGALASSMHPRVDTEQTGIHRPGRSDGAPPGWDAIDGGGHPGEQGVHLSAVWSGQARPDPSISGLPARGCQAATVGDRRGG